MLLIVSEFVIITCDCSIAISVTSTCTCDLNNLWQDLRQLHPSLRLERLHVTRAQEVGIDPAVGSYPVICSQFKLTGLCHLFILETLRP